MQRLHVIATIPFMSLVTFGCGAEGNMAPEGTLEDQQQTLRYGSFSFTDPAVGELRVDGQSCTATLVDPRAAVTAAHCVGFRSGTASGTFRIDISASNTHTYSVTEVKSFGGDFGHDDVAVVRLGGSVSSGVATPLAISCYAPLTNGGRVTLYGYGCRDTQGDSYLHHKQRYDTNFNALKFYVCPGDSGGPVIVTRPDNERVIAAVISGGHRVLPWQDWTPWYGNVEKHAYDVELQADRWAGRPAEVSSRCGGGGGGSSDDPPRHMN